MYTVWFYDEELTGEFEQVFEGTLEECEKHVKMLKNKFNIESWIEEPDDGDIIY